LNAKNILFRIFTIAITVLFLLQGYSFFESRRTIAQYRDREQEYTRTINEYRNQINECARVVSEVSTELGKGTESLQRQYSSIQELRSILREIEQNYEDMENIIGGFSISTNNSNTCGGN
jgi:chromosome segregation ATPase